MQVSLGYDGGLAYLEIVRPDAPRDLPLVVALHGRGATAEDLAPLAHELDSAGYRFIFPNGRLRLDLGGWEGYAWYAFESVAEDLAQSRAALTALLDAVWARTGLGPAQTVLLGFSQGAVLALDTGLRAPKRFAGLVAMSGYLYEDAELAAALARAREQRVLIIHGLEDPVLPVERGRRARQVLEAAGLRPEYHEFAMGHEVTHESLAVVAAFLHAVLPPHP
ncbi:MAG TPA: alpha/beta hydrolase-fold protein [Chloroflexota bacterium]|nr:alpha/beta hydrolase-fold protein [Chloroflexota bacterium]